MKKLALVLLCVLGLSRGLCAQDVAGVWQGTIANFGTRLVMTISKTDGGALATKFFIFKYGEYEADATSFDKGVLKVSLVSFGHTYEGKMEPDGKTITGSYTGSGGSIALNFERATKETAWVTDPTPHTVSFLTVEPGVKLEVVDWGGTGRPLVLLAGLGNNAHVFDTFAPKLIANYHVYGITRRGFGASDTPLVVGENYSADRLGDDVLSVIDQLKLVRPVIVGHSIAGEELSSIGSRHPERVAGLIYLDAGYWYALYPAKGNIEVDGILLQRQLKAINDAITPQDQRAVVETVLKALPRYQEELVARGKELQGMPDEPPVPAAMQKVREYVSSRAVREGLQRYTTLSCPVLAIFAEKQKAGPKDTKADVDRRAEALERSETQAKAFEALGPNVKVVRIPEADHYVFKSNEADVLREMNAFIAKLPL